MGDLARATGRSAEISETIRLLCHLQSVIGVHPPAQLPPMASGLPYPVTLERGGSPDLPAND